MSTFSAKSHRAAFTLVELLVVVTIIAVLIAMLFPAVGLVREQGRAAVCASNMSQCAKGIVLYANDHNNYLPPLYAGPNWEPGGGVPLWWFSPRWLGPYLGTRHARNMGPHRCPSSFRNGIGYNHHDLGRSLGGNETEFVYRMTQVNRPSATVAFADAVWIGNPTPADNAYPDRWYVMDDRQIPQPIFRTPSTGSYYNSMPERVFNRHNGKLNAGFLDGHVRRMKASELGFQYPHGHALALWDRE